MKTVVSQRESAEGKEAEVIAPRRCGRRIRFVLALAFLALTLSLAAAAAADDAADAALAHDLGVALFVAARNDVSARAEAIRSLEEALALAPNERRYVLDLADAYLRSGTDVGAVLAIDLYEDVLKQDPQSDALRARLAEAYAAIGNWDTALDFAASRLATATPDPTAVSQVVLLTMRSGKLDRGIATLEGVLRRSPKDNATRLFLATLYDARGDCKRALDFADAVAATEPAKSPLAREAERLGAEWRRGGIR